MDYPTTIQELFELAIRGKRSCINEYGYSAEYKELYDWAVNFAELHNLSKPTKEDCGVYY